jgi:hypothetical protein
MPAVPANSLAAIGNQAWEIWEHWEHWGQWGDGGQ